MRAPIVLLSVFGLAVFAGCHTVQTITRADLDAKYRENLGSFAPQVLYRGSADGFDYFVMRITAGTDFYCRISSTTITDLTRMPFSKDKSQWVVYDMNKEARAYFSTLEQMIRALEQQKKLIESLPKQ